MTVEDQYAAVLARKRYTFKGMDMWAVALVMEIQLGQ